MGNLDKEFENHWKRIGWKEGWEKGWKEGWAQGVEEERKKAADGFAYFVLALMKEKGCALEDSMRYVPSQIIRPGEKEGGGPPQACVRRFPNL